MDNKTLSLMEQGAWVHGGPADAPEVGALLRRCAETCHELNALAPSRTAERETLLRGLLGSLGSNPTIHSPFRCDIGANIHIGDNFLGNYNLSILDEARVSIGHNVFIGPNCCIATIVHALLPDQRNAGVMTSRPVTIGDNVWVAAGVTILPGITIGAGTVVGAGSVVTRPLPAGVLAVGNPCRPVRPITEADRVAVAR